MRTVLNVGGGGRHLPPQYNDWVQTLVDIDENVKPDICCDALELNRYVKTTYDAIYCSHTIEHFYKHDIKKLLANFHNALNEHGFVEIHTPNFSNMMAEMLNRNLDIDDVWYRTAAGMPITFHDTVHGWSVALQQGNMYYSHKCSFTAISLSKALEEAGFKNIQVSEQGANLMAVGFRAYQP